MECEYIGERGERKRTRGHSGVSGLKKTRVKKEECEGPVVGYGGSYGGVACRGGVHVGGCVRTV